MKYDILDAVSRMCPMCNQEMISLGLRPRKLGILAGAVTLTRRRLRCPSCGTTCYPLDKVIGGTAKHTLPVVERALYLSTDLSYEKASSTRLD